MSTYSSEVADWEGSGYGPLLATPSVRPIVPYHSACSRQAEYLLKAANVQIPYNERPNLVLLSFAPCKWRECCMQAHPGLTAASFPWPSGPAYKMRALQFPYTAGALVYARDRDSGEVYLGADGLPRFKYWPSAGDRDSMMKVHLLHHWG